MIGYAPTGLAAVAALAKVAVMLSPFLMPVIVPLNTGFASPIDAAGVAPVTVSGAGLTVRVPLVEVTE